MTDEPMKNEESAKPLFEQVREALFGPIPEKKTPWLRYFLAGVLFAIAFYAIGLGIYERNPKHHVEAIAFYIGAVALIGAFILTTGEK